jgi:hypothetical protein
MKLIFKAPLIEVTALKEVLEDAGMECFINNEDASQLAGGIPLNETIPELWIEDDSRLEEALQIKKAWLSPGAAPGPDWTCAKCGEKNEPQFTSCWKCGTAKP